MPRQLPISLRSFQQVSVVRLNPEYQSFSHVFSVVSVVVLIENPDCCGVRGREFVRSKISTHEVKILLLVVEPLAVEVGGWWVKRNGWPLMRPSSVFCAAARSCAELSLTLLRSTGCASVGFHAECIFDVDAWERRAALNPTAVWHTLSYTVHTSKYTFSARVRIRQTCRYGRVLGVSRDTGW